MSAVLLIPNLGGDGGVTFTNAIPALMDKYLPPGVLGVAVTGLVAAFMAGMAANVSSFNAVFTYDIWQDYVRPGRDDGYYLRVGRLVTIVVVLIGVGTAFIAAGFNNIMNYIQVLFSFFNVPLFTAFIIGMLWRRASKSAGRHHRLRSHRRPVSAEGDPLPQRPAGDPLRLHRRVRRGVDRGSDRHLTRAAEVRRRAPRSRVRDG